jgi:hypothetical protein
MSIYLIDLDGNQNGANAITALRVFRLVRVFQLAKLWKDFQEMLQVIISTLRDVSNISLLMGLFLFIYMLIGMELFAYRVPDLTLPAP